MIEVKKIEYLSDDYQASLDLRNRILREPIGLELTDGDIRNEQDVIHIACFSSENNNLIGACFLLPNTEVIMQLRQMAVNPDYQKKGIGRAIISFAERFACEKGYSHMYLHARKEAVNFYKKLGYELESDEFIEVGISHYEMLKRLE